ncbi:hypothetical protein TRIATDRAFT_303110 [Trichoderma atroviride IMI 206040]|uniref:Uncharacterized protein n=1 Tax=Hypocrea atroviridis (strain ATCC 20476 / IMI 206040) TaxID=452589 RepID=G9PBV0_HYPAI|nr:uncharacterized protein TRIATDRAFT_303110 [Trichoderma atroviride IMI 206040]EHK39844.1 hypothetical protein TRIATDRAFT_303110 [Trichoderma atroviride IMI 206040]
MLSPIRNAVFELNRVESSYGVPLRQIHRMHGMARSSLAAHYSLPKSSLANVELIQRLLTVKLCIDIHAITYLY